MSLRKCLCAMLALLLLWGAALPSSARGEEYTLPREEGTRQLTFYWDAEGADLATCDMWIWFPNADGHGYLFHPCAYGGKVVLNVPEDISRVGFIVRKNCSNPGGSSWGEATKDYEGDRFAQLTGEETEIYLKTGDKHMYLSDDHGKTLYEEKKLTMAGITAMDQIKYNLNPAARLTDLAQVKVTERDTGRQLPVTGLSSLNNSVVTGTVTLGEELDLSKVYTVEIADYGTVAAMPTKVFDTPAFVEQYTYDGDDLGATLTENGTVFRLWAPTASRVVLDLFEAGDGGEPVESVEMTRGEQGVWTGTSARGAGTYYTYRVTTAAGEQEAVDPYARAAGVNGNRGMVIDLDATDPAGFSEDTFVDTLSAYNEAVIWEVHVRDFSSALSASRYPGKYLAFTETGLTNAAGEKAGLDYLKDLGITHVHLQPIYDFATVDEAAEEPGFNWGYDPKNYNVPEGSYATDARDGAVRVNECKRMVQALHAAGIGVVMDVVYNHTYEGNSNLNRIVPYYYYRFDSAGGWSNGSGCGNETASERVMFRKYMVDSVRYWAEEYHVDGFRFDLMALHDTDTMQAVEQAVHGINPRALIYGEGWTGGTSALPEPRQSSQANISRIQASEGAIGAVAVFNDAIRDGLKGSVFNAAEKGYISGSVSKGIAWRVIFGLTGGERNLMVSWPAGEGGVINYMACHDNHTLFDRLLASNGDDTPAERLKMNRFGFSILTLGKGTVFFLAGEEMLRSKGGDGNSYKSGDAVNQLRWDDLTPGSDQAAMRDFYRGLIALRKENPFLREATLTCELLESFEIALRWTRNDQLIAFAIINPGEDGAYALPEGDWRVLLADERIDPAGTESLSGTVAVPGRTVLLVKK